MEGSSLSMLDVSPNTLCETYFPSKASIKLHCTVTHGRSYDSLTKRLLPALDDNVIQFTKHLPAQRKRSNLSKVTSARGNVSARIQVVNDTPEAS